MTPSARTPTSSRSRAASRRRTGRRALIVLGAAAAALAVAVLYDGSHPAAHSGASGPAQVPAASATASASSSFTAPASWVTLPTGSGSTGAMPTGFPHTPDGAAALAVEAVQYGWSTDITQARAAAALYADPPDVPAALDQATDLAAGLAGALGGSPASLPAGAGVATQVVGVRITLLDADDVGVALLVEVTYDPGSGAANSTRQTVLSALITWVPADPGPGDWRYTLAAAPPAPPAAALGSPAYNAAGWSAVEGAL